MQTVLIAECERAAVTCRRLSRRPEPRVGGFGGRNLGNLTMNGKCLRREQR